MNRRRIRRRASDIARVNPKRGLTSFILFAIALAIILIYQFSVSEDAAGIFGDVVGDPEMTMPATVLDQEQPILVPDGSTGDSPLGGTGEAQAAPKGPTADPEVIPSKPIEKETSVIEPGTP